jgi:thiol:disulfide interchange protein
MELATFHHEEVEPLLSTRFHLVKVDVTEGTDEQSTMQEAFGSATLPSVLVYGADVDLASHLPALRQGEPMPAAAVHFKTFVDAATFLAEIEPVR